mmetsp:Transcript_25953/g.79822  ORF Transcript_25953/g.79822 Transcript_25953/m.79822 type:complete len:157 (+) Transcript_25953:665-1135(+)
MRAAARRALERWRAAYARERVVYAAAHASRANLALHAALSPIEWAAALALVRWLAGGRVVWISQTLVALGTAAARPPKTWLFAAPTLLLATDLGWRPAKAALLWVGAIAAQVGVGHGLLDRTAPSVVEAQLRFQSIFLNVLITWDVSFSHADEQFR